MHGRYILPTFCLSNKAVPVPGNSASHRYRLDTIMAVKKLDPSRPITSAVVCWNGVERFDTAEGYIHVTKNLDIMGFNYCKTAWDDYHKRMPNQPVIITEASSNSGTRGCYDTDESAAQYYILDDNNRDIPFVNIL